MDEGVGEYGTDNFGGTELEMAEEGEDEYDEEDAQTIRQAVDGELAILTEGVEISSSQNSRIDLTSNNKAGEIDQSNPSEKDKDLDTEMKDERTVEDNAEEESIDA